LPATTATAQEAPARSPECLMPDRSPNLGWAPRVALFAALLPVLADCGPKRNQFAPPCPGPAILGDAADYDIYRGSSASRGVSDLTDLVLHARIVGVLGSCREGDEKNRLAVTVGVAVELNRGPAMQGREAEVPVFVAVTEGETILDKRTVRMPVVFPSNVDRVTLTSGENLLLPVTATKSGAAYTILAGFQLTPDQMTQTRRRTP
jgi:hypothetical protein